MVTLSELVAVEVMGWKWSDHTWWYGGRGAWIDQQKVPQSATLWNPDTNIADAWRVVEKMEHREPIVRRIVPLPREDGEPRWRCLMLASDDPEDVEHHWIEEDEYTISRRACVAEDENVCVAICLAALRACGVSEDRIEQARRKV